MIMSSGKSKASPPIRALVGPGNVLRFTVGNSRSDGGIAAAITVRAAQSFRWWKIRKNRGYSLKIVAETHVVIPFIVNTKGLNAVANRVVWELGEIWFPVRVD